ncbi:hypothetical protein B566_EDAN002363 [Ephemera danica]|nr:hypothetical protein B566_EDAN002363 [Ephemera danica]
MMAVCKLHGGSSLNPSLFYLPLVYSTGPASDSSSNIKLEQNYNYFSHQFVTSYQENEEKGQRALLERKGVTEAAAAAATTKKYTSRVGQAGGERPYKCHLPECGRAFIQLSNLQQHLRNHDAQVERAKNRPFHCNICGKGFATESSLRTHTSKR